MNSLKSGEAAPPARKDALSRKALRPILFALAGAIGCALGGAIGAPLLKTPPPAPVQILVKVPPQRVVLLLDVSGSMNTGGALDEVKKAATQFVERRDQNNKFRLSKDPTAEQDQIAILTFSSDVRVVVPMTTDAARLTAEIRQLKAAGDTATNRGLDAALHQLGEDPKGIPAPASNEQRIIFLFTDGVPDRGARNPSLELAKIAKDRGIKIIAVGTGTGTATFLQQLTNDVIPASAGTMGDKFDQVVTKLQAIRDDFLTKSRPPANEPAPKDEQKASFTEGLLHVLVVTTLMALGLSVALVIANNLSSGLKKTVLGPREFLTAIKVGILGGCGGGAAAHALYASLKNLPEALSKGVGWMVLGAVLGLSVRFFIPNVKWLRTLAGGGAGGLLAGWIFTRIASGFSDNSGVLVGAALLGFLIGLMIATVIVASGYGEAHLRIHHGKEEGLPMALGAVPVKLGSSPNAHIYLRNAPPEAGEILLTGGTVIWHDLTKNTQTPLAIGQRLKVGHLEIEVAASKAKGVNSAPSTV